MTKSPTSQYSMPKPNIIHVSAFPEEKSWFEGLLNYLYGNGFAQSIVSVSQTNKLVTCNIPIQINTHKSENKLIIFRFISTLLSVRRCRKSGLKNVIIAQGHLESTTAYLVSRFLGLDYILIYHMQPGYFKLLKRDKPVSSFVHGFFQKLYTKNATAIQSLSRDVSNYIAGLGVTPTRIIEIPHGVDFSGIEQQFLTTNSLEPRGFFRILMAGRLSPEKNHELALKSFVKFLESYPNAILTIAGEGPCRDHIEEIITELGISSSVELLGFSPDIITLMRNSDALLHVAATESYGRVYLEALICDLPVFTFKVGATLDLESNSSERLVFLGGSTPAEIGEKMSAYFNNDLARGRLTMPQFAKYGDHDQNEVFRRIATFIPEVLKQ
jgi:glycosyltransferase involved in cell wall biosynthesis